MRREDIAYLAGFFDGEGSVTINHVKRTDRTVSGRYKNDSYTLQVVIGNTDPTVPNWAQSMFGGYVIVREPRSIAHRPSFSWLISNYWAMRFLETIRPYIRMKGDVVDLAIRFQRAMKKHGPKATPPEVIAWREEQRLAIRMLNGRKKKEGDPLAPPVSRESPDRRRKNEPHGVH
jgi:hypothetical protein